MVHTFSNQKSQFGYILEGLAMEDVGIFMATLSILRPNATFGTFCGHLVHFFPFWFIVQRKIWQPCQLTVFSTSHKRTISMLTLHKLEDSSTFLG
jgi:hypothetical protein